MSEPLTAEDALAAASVALGRSLTLVASLGGSPRSGVWRADDGTGTVVVKAHRAPEGRRGWTAVADSWERECWGLRAAGPSGVAPGLLAVDREARLVVMEDLGAGADVAESLLSDDPLRAERGVLGWAEAVARLHSGTVGLPEPEGFAVDEMPRVVAESADELNRLCVELGVDTAGTTAFTRLAGTLDRGKCSTLSPGDVCPDNNKQVGGRLRLFDFEFADLRHPAWDAAYLCVPWPTCWCAWQLPDDLGRRALDRYRGLLAPAIPYVASDAFERDVGIAALVWCLTTTAWFLPSALADDPALHHPATPRRRATVLHRLELAASLPGPDRVLSLAEHLSRALLDRWGEHELAVAPAFRDALDMPSA